MTNYKSKKSSHIISYFKRSLEQWNEHFKNVITPYKGKKSLLFLDVSLYSLMLGMILYLLLIVPSLDMEGKMNSGLIMITLFIFSVFIYAELKRYILSKSQRKLDEWTG